MGGALTVADRETELRELIARAHRRFYEDTAPLFEELAKIEEAKPPRPLVYLQPPEIPQYLLDQLDRSRERLAAQLGIQATEP